MQNHGDVEAPCNPKMLQGGCAVLASGINDALDSIVIEISSRSTITYPPHMGTFFSAFITPFDDKTS